MAETFEQIREGWVNFYPAGSGFIADGGWASKEEADQYVWEGHIRIGCRKIVLNVNGVELG